MKNEIVLFTDGDFNIEVQINPDQENWMKLLSVFPTEVQGEENLKFIKLTKPVHTSSFRPQATNHLPCRPHFLSQSQLSRTLSPQRQILW